MFFMRLNISYPTLVLRIAVVEGFYLCWRSRSSDVRNREILEKERLSGKRRLSRKGCLSVKGRLLVNGRLSRKRKLVRGREGCQGKRGLLVEGRVVR